MGATRKYAGAAGRGAFYMARLHGAAHSCSARDAQSLRQEMPAVQRAVRASLVAQDRLRRDAGIAETADLALPPLQLSLRQAAAGDHPQGRRLENGIYRVF